MENIAPDIKRQRLLLEAFYTIPIDRTTIEDYFKKITDQLQLRRYGEPIIFSPGDEGKTENQGYDAFIPLIDSGISLYVWSKANFISIILYTCKEFDEEKAITYTKAFFKAKKIVFQSF
ncbi:MAG TPA: S-adenosylmethionine decarboxylase [Candidatus Nanoarchaeia archaeon]|nr:S-adenosylmethionine decarboxylase [Candidatus Nanoarchaeia archaeon]